MEINGRQPFKQSKGCMNGLSCDLVYLMPLVLLRELMNDVLKPFIGHFVPLHFDDILIYSQNERDHKEHLRQAFEVLRGHKLYIKIEKCEFFIP